MLFTINFNQHGRKSLQLQPLPIPRPSVTEPAHMLQQYQPSIIVKYMA